MIVNRENLKQLESICIRYERQVKYYGMYEDIKEERKERSISITELIDLYINEYIPVWINEGIENGYTKEELSPYKELLNGFKALNYNIKVVK